jgi:mannosyltransferase OCH1-like enzyme
MIPKVIYLTYKDHNIPEYVIPNWENLNQEYKVEFYTDKDCRNFLQENYPAKYLEFFDFVKDGPIKSDFFRVCILYKFGGIYADIDIQPIESIDLFLGKDVSFLTVLSKPSNGLINPHFIACTPNNTIIKKIIDGFFDLKKNKVPYSYHAYSIVPITGRIFYKMFGGKSTTIPMKGPWTICSDYFNIPEGIYKKPEGIIQLLQETCPKDFYECAAWYKSKKILLNRYKTYINHTF